MIIISTKNGDILVNDTEAIQVKHLKDKSQVQVIYRDASPQIVEDVIDMRYMANTPIDWRDKGNLLLKTEERIKEMEEDAQKKTNYSYYFRSNWMECRGALEDFVSACKNFNNSDERIREKAQQYAQEALDKCEKLYNDMKEKGQIDEL